MGLSMVRWDLGVIGYVSATQQGMDTAYSEIFLRCYPTTIDMTREMRGKVTCVLNAISRGLPINAVAFLLDPYGIANDVGTKYGVVRSTVLNIVYSWFANYLRSNGFLEDSDIVEFDEELKILTPFIKARVEGSASRIAGIIATIVTIKGVDKQRLPIRIIDLKRNAEEYVREMLKKGS